MGDAPGGARILSCLVLAAVAVHAQPPAISSNGVVNAASRIPTPLAGGSIARGARFVIRGVRLAPDPVVRIGRFTAPVIAASAGEIEARMPENAPIGEVPLTVTVKGAAGAPFAVKVVRASFGIFTRNEAGWGPGRIDNFDSAGARSSNTLANPARPGQTVVLQGTGLGGHTPEIHVGGRKARLIRTAKAAAGIDELVLETPAGAPDGCYVPVQATGPGLPASNTAAMAIDSRGRPCTIAPYYPFPAWLSGKSAFVILSRTVWNSGPPVDDGAAFFVERDSSGPYSPLVLSPPPETCSTYVGSGESGIPRSSSLAVALIGGLPGKGLDAGPRLTVSRGSLLRGIQPAPAGPGVYRSKLRAEDRLFDAGDIRVSGPGGPDVSGFAVTVSAPRPFVWTNRQVLSTIDRARGMTVEWQGAGPEHVMAIVAVSVDAAGGTAGVCWCLSPQGANRFTIPARALANLPATAERADESDGMLLLASWPAGTWGTIAGMRNSIVVTSYVQAANVRFR